MSAVQERTAQMVELFTQLSEEEQKAILKALKKKQLLEEARKLDQTVWKYQISEEEILDAVNEVRQKLYEAGKNSV
ncbi:MAG: hypothetical protein OHK0019_23540 [Saprospiraceae bacterium]